MKIVVDTNLLIDFSRSNKVGKDKDNILWLKLVKYCKKEGHQLIVPAITVFEFFSGEEMNNKVNREKANNVLKDTLILDFDEEIAKEAASLFRKYKKNMGIIDYFLVAMAIVCKGELATLNLKHFNVFKELNIFDLQKLE